MLVDLTTKVQKFTYFGMKIFVWEHFDKLRVNGHFLGEPYHFWGGKGIK